MLRFLCFLIFLNLLCFLLGLCDWFVHYYIWFLVVLSFLVCEFVFLWLWPESLFFALIIFLAPSFLLQLLLQLCCTVLLEELVCFHFMLFFYNRLIPTLFLILGWGYQPERVQAGIIVLYYIYCILASLPYSLVFCLLIILWGHCVYSCCVVIIFGMRDFLFL